jgi:hypothetical protein
MVEPKTQRDKEINGWFEGSVWSESAHLYFDPETEYNPDDLSDEEKTERGWTLNSFYKKWEPPKPKKEPDPVKMPPVEQLDLALQTMARKDPVFFNEYILRDEQSGKHIQLAQFQKDWFTALKTSRFLNLIIPPEHGKTVNLSIGYVLWLIGNNPGIRIVIVHRTEGMAVKVLNAIKSYIQHSAAYKKVFPNVDRGNIWKENQIIVKRKTTSKDFTVQSVGIFGPVDGSRYDVVIMDDPLSYENTSSATQRERLSEWVKLTLSNRVVENGTLVVLNNAWNQNDLAHNFAKNVRYKTIINKTILDDGSMLWPERWSANRVKDKKEEIGSIAFEQMYQSDATSGQGGLIDREWILYGDAPDPKQLTCISSYDISTGEGSADFGGVVFGYDADRNKVWVIDAHSGKKTVMAREQAMDVDWKRFGLDGLVYEIAGQQADSFEYVRQNRPHLPMIRWKPVGNKVSRLTTASVHLEGAQIMFDKSMDPDYPGRADRGNLVAALRSAKGVGNQLDSTNKDLCDAFSQGIGYIFKRIVTEIVSEDVPDERKEQRKKWAENMGVNESPMEPLWDMMDEARKESEEFKASNNNDPFAGH